MATDGIDNMFSYKSATEAHSRVAVSRYSARMPLSSSTCRTSAASFSAWPARCLLAALWVPCVASATLGQDATTVENDRAHMQAQRHVTQAAGYTVHELQLAGGTRVREYISSGQQVFAVAWNGPRIPDLQQLLGAYVPRYQGAAGLASHARRPVVLHDADLVIETGGHTRAFFGVVYLPRQLPAGLGAEQIR
jgi:hypothetical protein